MGTVKLLPLSGAEGVSAPRNSDQLLSTVLDKTRKQENVCVTAFVTLQSKNIIFTLRTTTPVRKVLLSGGDPVFLYLKI